MIILMFPALWYSITEYGRLSDLKGKSAKNDYIFLISQRRKIQWYFLAKIIELATA